MKKKNVSIEEILSGMNNRVSLINASPRRVTQLPVEAGGYPWGGPADCRAV